MKTQDWSYSIRAQDSIAQGALTNSKRPECFVKGIYQTHVSHAQGPFVTDVSGHRLFDFICGLGSMLIGHGNHQIANAIYQRAVNGITLSLGSTLEIQLAEKIKEIVPWVQKFKFLKTGSEACSAAVKIARAKTNRCSIFSEGYHGWHDPFHYLAARKNGLEISGSEKQSSGAPWVYGINDLNDKIGLFGQTVSSPLDHIDDSVAGVIVEPIITDMSDERIAFLRALREKCTKHRVMLIFDEVITGLRFPKFTVSSYLGIEPDIICLGKALGGGMPLSCIAGKDDVMNCGEYFVSSTFAGEMCSMAASMSLITQLQTSKFNLNDLWERGAYFREQFNSLYPEKIKIVGYPSRGVFEGDPLVKALLWQEAYNAGILFGSSFFLSFSHLAYLDRVLNILEDIILRIKTGSIGLHGEMPKAPFAQTLRGNK